MSKRPNSVIARVKSAVGSDQVAATRQRLEEQQALVEQRRKEREQADEDVTAAQAARLANMEADDAALDALDAAIKAAQVAVLRTADRLAVAERRLTEAEQLASSAKAEAAQAAIAEIHATESVGLVNRYVEVCRTVLAMLQDMARVDQTLATIASEGGIERPSSIEVTARVRLWAAYDEPVSSEVVTLWTDRAGTIIAPQPEPSDVKRDGAGCYLQAPSGVINMGREWNSNHQMEIRQKRFRKVVTLERDPTAGYIEPWASKLLLPGLGAGHSAIFHADGLSETSVAAAIAKIEAQLAELNSKNSPRNKVERLTPVSDTEAEAAA